MSGPEISTKKSYFPVHIAFKKHLAIKVVRSGMDSGEIVARFRRERQILASLDHPNAPGEGEHSL